MEDLHQLGTIEIELNQLFFCIPWNWTAGISKEGMSDDDVAIPLAPTC